VYECVCVCVCVWFVDLPPTKRMVSPGAASLSCRKSATAGTIRDRCDTQGPHKRDTLHHAALDTDILTRYWTVIRGLFKKYPD